MIQSTLISALYFPTKCNTRFTIWMLELQDRCVVCKFKVKMSLLCTHLCLWNAFSAHNSFSGRELSPSRCGRKPLDDPTTLGVKLGDTRCIFLSVFSMIQTWIWTPRPHSLKAHSDKVTDLVDVLTYETVLFVPKVHTIRSNNAF